MTACFLGPASICWRAALARSRAGVGWRHYKGFGPRAWDVGFSYEGLGSRDFAPGWLRWIVGFGDQGVRAIRPM